MGVKYRLVVPGVSVYVFSQVSRAQYQPVHIWRFPAFAVRALT